MFSRAVRGQPYHVGPSMVGTWDKGARARAQRLVLFLLSESQFAFMGLRLFYLFFAWRECMKPLRSDLRLAFACAWCERLLLAAAARVAALFVFPPTHIRCAVVARLSVLRLRACTDSGVRQIPALCRVTDDLTRSARAALSCRAKYGWSVG